MTRDSTPSEDAPLAGADDDATRTRTGSSDDGIDARPPARPPLAASERRLPAPLQYRDPDRYEIVAEHGRGGLGRVFRARDKELGRDVALKELLTRGSTTELRFFREALITARLEHPGIVPIHEAGRWPDGTPFYAMKLVAGRPLKALIEDCKTLEDRLALLPNIIAVADAIAYAHDRKIIHRDLKPSNVIVGDFGETVVIDWGLAKDISAQDDIPDPLEEGPFRTAAPPSDGVTVAGSILGTPAYMSPEQARGEPVDERADVYAIGVILADVLSSRSTRREWQASARRAEAELRAVVERATNPAVALRYPSASQIAADLRRYISKQPLSAYQYSMVERSMLWLSARRGAAAIATCSLFALFILAATATIVVSRQRQAATRSASIAEGRVDELTLARASDWLSKDARLSLTWLEKYLGRDGRWQYAAALTADAVSRGYATHLLSGHLGRITALSASAKGDYAVSTSTDGTAILWDASGRTFNATRVCEGLGDPAAAIVSGNQPHVAAATGTEQLALCDVSTRTNRIIPLEFTPLTLRFSSSGSLLAAIGTDGDIAILDTRTATILWRERFSPTPTFFEFLTEDTLLVGAHTHFAAVNAFTGKRTSGDVPLPHGDVAAFATTSAASVLLATSGCLLVHQGAPIGLTGSQPSWRCSEDATPAPPADPASSLSGALGAVAVAADRDSLAFSLGHSSWLYSLRSESFSRLSFPDDVTWLTFSPTSEHVYATHTSGDVSWTSTNGSGAGRLAGHGKFAFLGAFLQVEGTWRLLSAGADSDLRIWSAPPHTETSHTPSVLYDAVYSPGLNGFVSDGQDGDVRMWSNDAHTAQSLWSGDRSIAHGIAVSRNGATVATAHWSGNASVWLRSSHKRVTLHANATLSTIDVSPNGEMVAAGDLKGRVGLWEVGEAKARSAGRFIAAHAGMVTHVRFLSDQLVLSASKDGTVVLIDIQTGRHTVAGSSLTSIEALATSPDEGIVAFGDRQGVVQIAKRRGSSLVPLARCEIGEWVSALAATSATVLVGTRSGRLIALSTTTCAQRQFDGHTGPVREIQPISGHRVVTGSHDGTVRIWDLNTGQSSVLRASYGDIIEGIAVNEPSGAIAAVGWLGNMYRWNISDMADAPPADSSLPSWIAGRLHEINPQLRRKQQ